MVSLVVLLCLCSHHHPDLAGLEHHCDRVPVAGGISFPAKATRLCPVLDSLGDDGYEILTAASASEALELLEAREVAAVLSDHKMPGRIAGLDLLERAAAIRPAASLLLVTGWPEEVDPARARALGIRAVIPKPWDDADLKATLRKALR